MATQWNTGMGGVTGLKYESLPAVMRYAGVPRALHADTFEALRVMETEAMAVINGSSK